MSASNRRWSRCVCLPLPSRLALLRLAHLPQNNFHKRWDVVIVLSLLFTALVTPFEVAFLRTQLNVLFFINRFVDIIFLLVSELHRAGRGAHGLVKRGRRRLAKGVRMEWSVCGLGGGGRLLSFCPLCEEAFCVCAQVLKHVLLTASCPTLQCLCTCAPGHGPELHHRSVRREGGPVAVHTEGHLGGVHRRVVLD